MVETIIDCAWELQIRCEGQSMKAVLDGNRWTTYRWVNGGWLFTGGVATSKEMARDCMMHHIDRQKRNAQEQLLW